MPNEQWLMVGICGVTCGGKTTLASKLKNVLQDSILFNQDDYFLDVNDHRHTYVPDLNHINFDVLTSLDMEKMHRDILASIGSKQAYLGQNSINKLHTHKEQLSQKNLKIYIIEGFSIFNYKPIADMCHLKYYFTLTEEECYDRRIQRTYEPPDCPQYFEKCVWPEYLSMYEYVKKHVIDVKYLDGSKKLPLDEILNEIYTLITGGIPYK